jgi:hypothetical protein
MNTFAQFKLLVVKAVDEQKGPLRSSSTEPESPPNQSEGYSVGIVLIIVGRGLPLGIELRTPNVSDFTPVSSSYSVKPQTPPR